MVVVPIVDSVYGIPACSATATTARSPAVFIIRVKPVGAKANGSVDRRPSISRLVSTTETSRSTVGWNSTRAKAALARFSDSSPSAAPSV